MGERENRGLLGAFTPKCKDDGSYETQQCHGSSGYCWCVNKSGTEIQGTRKGPGRFRGCEQYENTEESGKSNCLEEYNRKVSLRRPDDFIPECDESGEYKTLQCYGFLEECWCVDKITGDEFDGTRGPNTNDPEICEKIMSSKCFKEVKQFKMENPRGLPGAFVPECSQDGSYKDKQCHGSTGHCWCVDEMGKEISNTRKQFQEADELICSDSK